MDTLTIEVSNQSAKDMFLTLVENIKGARIIDNVDCLENDSWDEQMAKDASSGKFDQLADQAISEFKAGETLPL